MAIDITGFPPPQPQGTGGSTNSASNGSGNTAQAVATASRADTVTLTPQASQLKKVESTIDAQSVVDGERVQNLKSAIDAGMYEINAQRVAEKFIQFENNLRS